MHSVAFGSIDGLVPAPYSCPDEIGLLSIGRRGTAGLALSAFVAVILLATPGFAVSAEAGGEPCLGCVECERGNCSGGHGNDFTSHHHCCATCCMSHAAFALPTALSSPRPVRIEPTPTRTAGILASLSREAPYRPPRA